MTDLAKLRKKINILHPFLKKGSIDKSIVTFLKSKIDEIIPFLSVPIFDTEFMEIHRITINKKIKEVGNNRITFIKHLKYPHESYVKKYGRANYNYQSRFYGTFDPMTALKEMKPDIGDVITESIWRLKNFNSLKVAPIFMITSINNGQSHNELSLRFKIGYENLMAKYSNNEASQFQEVLLFIAECFAKEVDYENSYDYFLSSFLSNKIFNEINNGEVEAIVYPSVPSELGFSNIVIKPASFDSKYELKYVNEKRIISTKSWYLNITGHSSKFVSDKLLWD